MAILGAIRSGLSRQGSSLAPSLASDSRGAVLPGYGLLRPFLAVVLLLASGLKAWQLAQGDGDDLLPRWLAIAGFQSEFVLGCWLLSGAWRTGAWRAALLFFGLVAGISLAEGLRGYPLCGCFGRFDVSPWYVFAFDVLVVGALLRWRPGEKGATAVSAVFLPAAAGFAGLSVASRILRRICGPALLLSVAASGYLLGDSQLLARKRIIPLSVPSDSLSLGTVWARSDFRCVLPVHNPTTNALELVRLSTHCCGDVRIRPVVIEAGQTVAVPVTINLLERDLYADFGHVRKLGLNLRPVIRGFPPLEGSWFLHGAVRHALAVPAIRIDLGNEIIRGQSVDPYSLEVTLIEPTSGVSVMYPIPSCVVEIQDNADIPGVLEVRVTPRTDLPVGPLEFDLQLQPHGDFATPESQAPPLVVHVKGRIVEDVEVVPAVVMLGAVRRGDVVRESITLRSRTGHPFAVTSVTCNPSGAVVAQVNVRDGLAQCEFDLIATVVDKVPIDVEFAIQPEKAGTQPFKVSVVVISHLLDPVRETAEGHESEEETARASISVGG